MYLIQRLLPLCVSYSPCKELLIECDIYCVDRGAMTNPYQLWCNLSSNGTIVRQTYRENSDRTLPKTLAVQRSTRSLYKLGIIIKIIDPGGHLAL